MIKNDIKMTGADISVAPRSSICVCVCVFVCITFLLVFVDVHLSLLLEAECVDDGDGQSQGFPGVTVGTESVNAGTCRRDVVCVFDRATRWG